MVPLPIICIITNGGTFLIDVCSHTLVREDAAQRQNVSTLISMMLSYPAVTQQLIELPRNQGEQQIYLHCSLLA